MKPDDLRQISGLIEDRAGMLRHFHTLNDIAGGAEFLSLPIEALRYVDSKDVARGLISLLIPEINRIERQLADLGVDLEENAGGGSACRSMN